MSAHPRYAYTVEATERNRSGNDETTVLRVTVDDVKNTENVHVVSGKGAGSDLTWSGDDSIVVRGPGLAHIIAVRIGIRDERILSPRRNDVRTAIFARATRCFVDNAAHVRAVPGAARDLSIVMTDERGINCGPEYADGTITTDRITVDASDGRPLMRERLEGPAVVARWVIRDVVTPA